jgi:endoglucanase
MTESGLIINDQDYFDMPGLNVLVYHNTFSEGHQDGIEIILHENRVATGGNLRLNPAPGQWQPIPKVGEGFEQRGVSPLEVALHSRILDRENNEIRMPCSYPDESRHRKGFNPLIYPDLQIQYTVRVKAQGTSFTISVDMAEPIPENWVGRIGYNLELFPGDLYGKSYYMDEQPGIFPRQAAGPTYFNPDGDVEATPLAEGHTLSVAPECEKFRMTIESKNTPLQLLDGSLTHNNGWFVVRSLVPEGATKNAIQWTVTPYVIPNYKYEPVVHLSQVGYHPQQRKVAYIELDKRETDIREATLVKIAPSGEMQTVLVKMPERWGQYLRYQYAIFDFSEVTDPGIYQVQYGDFTTNPFQIDPQVYKRHVWQPTLEYFLPMQMCHMRVNQKYRVWHGLCHMDDALMAPLHNQHFDGYQNLEETSTLCAFKPLEHIPNMNAGGWHDAADDDLRTETQVQTTLVCALTYEEFGIEYDQTYIDQANHHVEIHQPDGKPDLLQQVEHGVLTILSAYRQLGRLYRGIIVPTLRQYVHLGDPSTQTDNQVFNDDAGKSRAANIEGLWYKKVANRYSRIFDPELNLQEIEEFLPGMDDRLLFMASHPWFQIYGVSGLAVASRVLKGYDDALATECLQVAEALWEAYGDAEGDRLDALKIQALAELILSTGKDAYKQTLCGMQTEIRESFSHTGWTLGRVLPLIDCPDFQQTVTEAAKAYKTELDEIINQSPFGCPLENTERIGFEQYFLHKAWPEIFSPEPLFNVVNYQLGCRPGRTTNSLVSGVGVESPTVAYGFNRADWSYIPGGTFWNAVNLVSPDFPEDKVWPFLWQEREYITNESCMYMFAVIAADRLLEAGASR